MRQFEKKMKTTIWWYDISRWLRFFFCRKKCVLFFAIKWISNRIDSIWLMMVVASVNYTILPILMVNFNIITFYAIFIPFISCISFSSGLQAAKQWFIKFTCQPPEAEMAIAKNNKWIKSDDMGSHICQGLIELILSI